MRVRWVSTVWGAGRRAVWRVTRVLRRGGSSGARGSRGRSPSKDASACKDAAASRGLSASGAGSAGRRHFQPWQTPLLAAPAPREGRRCPAAPRMRTPTACPTPWGSAVPSPAQGIWHPPVGRRPHGMARVGEEFPLECPNCGGDIRLIAFRLVYECETIPGLRTLGNLRLLRTSCPRAGADPENPNASRRTVRAAARVAGPGTTHRLGRAHPGA